MQIPDFDISDLDKALARKKLLSFIRYNWKAPIDPITKRQKEYLVGFHTQRICDRLDMAVEDYRKGKSSYIAIAIHQRSGKTEICGINLPAQFIGNFPGHEVIYTTYNSDLAQLNSGKAKDLFESPECRELFPNVTLAADSQSKRRWNVVNGGKKTNGGFTAVGLSSGLTGRGGNLIILDDYVSGREEAESEHMREILWERFTNDLMTRLEPVHIVIILATWWHEDDIRGRIMKKNNPESEDYDPDFPVFEYLDFPARAEDWKGDGEYPGDYLFTKTIDGKGRFPESWYKSQYASLGHYASAGMMDCNPQPRTGFIVDVDNVVIHPTAEEFPKNLNWFRVWDYAHSAKQRVKDDPDFTGGTLVAYRRKEYNAELKQYVVDIWIKDYIQFREKAPERDRKVREITQLDGPMVKVIVENSIDSKDGAEYLKQQLYGLRTVNVINCKGDKAARLQPLEPIFEAGNIHICRGAWNSAWKDGFRKFDGTGKTHDEMVDNLTAGYEYFIKNMGFGVIDVHYQ